jgi:hypothetical protein
MKPVWILVHSTTGAQIKGQIQFIKTGKIELAQVTLA